ncbi:MAG TPA: holo-ACP synthase [Candidatus Subteraquimicrobiales bacterium]
MVKGIGVDLVEIKRIKEAIESHAGFVDRVFTPEEQKYCLSKARPYLHFAVRFAAKEAIMKALGSGFRGVKWVEIETARDSSGRPSVNLKGATRAKAKENKIGGILVSLSFSGENAIASAVSLGEQESG